MFNYLCPAGYACREGTSPSTQRADPCPPGYICQEGTAYSIRLRSACPRGYYCPRGTHRTGGTAEQPELTVLCRAAERTLLFDLAPLFASLGTRTAGTGRPSGSLKFQCQ